jgi:hypothetical protein
MDIPHLGHRFNNHTAYNCTVTRRPVSRIGHSPWKFPTSKSSNLPNHRMSHHSM